MYINIEFLDVEPIENIITCMHHKMDKVIFFGYKETIQECQKRTSNFLKKHCGVLEVEFCSIKKRDLNDVINCIESKVKAEEALGHSIYFDITGGESLCLVAFGALAEKLRKPMHMYDIEENQLIQLGADYEDHIGNVPKNHVNLNLAAYIEMQGAKINEQRMGVIDICDNKFISKELELWKILMTYKHQWNDFSNVLRDSLSVEKSLEASNFIRSRRDMDLETFHAFMNDLKKMGVLSYYHYRIVSKNQNGKIAEAEVKLAYSSFAWKECMTKAGTALELHVYKALKDVGKEVSQSVRIDWDGIILGNKGQFWDGTQDDVLNEVDVLMLEGNVPTFISCKAGRLNKGKALQPLYELETVATRFGGKYAKKVLATLYPIEGVYAERAKEMDIELRCYDEERIKHNAGFS